ncbi:HAD-IIA family hydrolase [Sphaerobacter thermophilus]|jgi:4-nitrophenyl phosphatase|uniref:HAD-superfamily hydrolase, subfamily IIA n=1 Tax=Sphaerobacter thermophilus (strain ATCC 49802 / DSM 20745 / KCCM 41009 / NCIMB 13125 / S 6022) TaxID=479434 RepID=D1C7Q2_SPHTD|nr:HAD-IIA family hydrolase [Sphaerobacter thermophilus]ACZ37885.1 HAD-superfamily hydrolase, subfamily IIA [Sphaerobacter thermophilus DSM 20745]
MTLAGADIAPRLAPVRGYVIDMDGVLYRGDTALPHAREFLAALDARGIPYVMATNNSTRTPEQYTEKLARMGIPVPPERIVTSSLATRAWLEERYPAGTRVHVLGMAALRDAILGDGRFQSADLDAEVVVTGADWELTYDKLARACLAIRRGATWVATNPDTTFPTEEGLVPGAGAILAALRVATSREPIVIGKPEPGMLLEAGALMGIGPESTAVLGDRLDTDIQAGQRAGFTTVLVLTGVTSAADLATESLQPDLVVPDLAPLLEYYRTLQ